MPYSTLRYEVADTGVATISLDQPETRNALSDEVLADLLAAFTAARDDDAVRCVVLTSTHEKVFSSGGDLGGFAADVPLVHKHLGTDRFPRLFRLIGELGKPSLCAANGHVLAGALGLALACDLVIAREGATFGTPEINVGVFPFMIMALIYRNVGRKKTNELLLLGERVDAHEAQRLGLVNRVVAADEFDAAVADWAGRLAAKSPVLMRLGKDAMYRQQDMAFADALEYLRLSLTLAFSTRGHPGGRQGLLRAAGAQVDRPLSLVALPCRTSDRAPEGAQGALALAAELGRRRGVEPRVVGEPGEPRVGELRRRPARLARLPAGGRRPGRRRAGRRRATPCSSPRTARSASRRCPRCCATCPTRRVLWLDAHGDFNTPDTTPSGFLGGMCLAAACGEWDAGFDGPRVDPAQVVMCGVRDLDGGERVLLETRGVGVVERPVGAGRRARRAPRLRAPRPRRARPLGAAGAVPGPRRAVGRRAAHAAGRGRRGGRPRGLRDHRLRAAPTARDASRRSSSRWCPAAR